MTEQRRAILAAFERGQRPLSPSEVLERATQEVESLNLTTVYRALKALQESGDITAVAVVGKSTRYERSGLAHHHHFLCEDCDRLFDMPGCPGTFRQLAPDGFEVTGHELLLKGRCEACA